MLGKLRRVVVKFKFIYYSKFGKDISKIRKNYTINYSFRKYLRKIENSCKANFL